MKEHRRHQGKLFGRILIVTFSICCLFSGCSEDIHEDPEKFPSAYPAEFNISYSGTAVVRASSAYGGRKLHFHIEHKHTSSYSDFSVSTYTRQLKEGKTLFTPYDIDPGITTVTGFWDWNDNDLQDDYEPYIAPVTEDLSGFDTARFDIVVVDKTLPDADGWIEGTIKLRNIISGSHHLYLTAFISGEYYEVFPLTTEPYDFSSGVFYIAPIFLDPHEFYVISAFWDMNGDGIYGSSDVTDLVNIPVSPGLPWTVSFELF